jgi:signal peptide peptidase SppA
MEEALMRTLEALAIDGGYYREWLEATTFHREALFARLHEPESAAKLIPSRKSTGNVAVLSLSGFISPRPTMMSLLFGGTSAEGFAREVQSAMLDPEVSAVVMDVNSPGGSVFGIPEAAAKIRSVRGLKPMVSVSNPLMASAAYHLASQADEVVTTQSGLTGSIGAFALHVDESASIAAQGLKVTEIAYGRRKTEASSVKPLSDEALGAIQEQVDYYGKLFEADVAAGRRTSIANVRARYGEGAMFTAPTARSSGLVDRIATLDEVVSELSSGSRKAIGPRAYQPARLQALALAAGLTNWRTGR